LLEFRLVQRVLYYPIFRVEMAGERRIAAWRMDKGGGPLF
jgi:hypothetical protein